MNINTSNNMENFLFNNLNNTFYNSYNDLNLDLLQGIK